jgi:hypothetical protein
VCSSETISADEKSECIYVYHINLFALIWVKISHVILFGDESDKARDQRECFDVVIGKTEAMLC